MTDAERAGQMQALVERLITAMATLEPEPDIATLTGALGAVCGTFAAVTGSPAKFMAQVNACAQGVIDGTLLNAAEPHT